MQIRQPIILFDGICNLCNGTVDFLLKRDRTKQFSFVPLQSDEGQLIIQKFQIPVETDSVVLIDLDSAYFESEAIVKIAEKLPYPWKMVEIVKFIPEKIRNGLYRLVANNRYGWFGKRSTCRISIENDD